jgi:hypothetical protein
MAITSSNPITSVTTIHGRAENKTKAAWELSITQLKPIRIFRRVWPAIMLAKSRIERLKIREKYEINSTAAIKGARMRGDPVGTPNAKME